VHPIQLDVNYAVIPVVVDDGALSELQDRLILFVAPLSDFRAVFDYELI